jgi:hypothetical protein
MYIFLLERIESPIIEPGTPDPWPAIMVDGVSAMTVIADDQDGARHAAADAAGDEGRGVWLNPRFTACENIGVAASGIPPGVLVKGEPVHSP